MYTCDDCGLNIKTKYNFNKHKTAKVSCKMKKNLINGRLKCPRCPASFTRQDNLTRHFKAWHKHEDPTKIITSSYSCGLCKKAFRDIKKLQEHRKEEHATHTDFRLIASAHNRSCQLLRAFFPQKINEMDPVLFYMYDIVTVLLINLLIKFSYFKINLVAHIEMMKFGEHGEIVHSEVFAFRGNGFKVIRGSPFRGNLQKAVGDIERNVSEFLYMGSGWIMSKPLSIDVEVMRCEPLYGEGGCSKHIVKFLRNGGISPIINQLEEDNNDGLCFYNAIATGMCGGKNATKKMIRRFLKEKLNLHDGTKTSFSPMKVKDIASFEEKFNFTKSINVVYKDEEGTILPLYASKKIHLKPLVLMLFYVSSEEEGEDYKEAPTFHYAYVNDPRKLFAQRQKGIRRKDYDNDDKIVRTRNTYICWNCVNPLKTRGSYESHVKFCHTNNTQQITMPNPGDKITFKKQEHITSRSFKAAYILTFDFESLQVPANHPCSCSEEVLRNTETAKKDAEAFNKLSEDEKDDYLAQQSMLAGEYAGEEDLLRFEAEIKGNKHAKKPKRLIEPKLCPHRTRTLKEQPPFAYSLVLCDRNKNILETKKYMGEDAADDFMKTVLEIGNKYLPTLSPGRPIEPMTKEEKKLLYQRKNCYLCGGYAQFEERVLDHDHLTGKYLGTAHNSCNLQRKEVPTIAAFCHNFSNYDSHFIVRALNKYYKGPLFAVPVNSQKFKCFQLGKNLTFLDSISFVPDTLAKCVNTLKLSGNPFSMVRSRLAPTQEKFDLLTRKGVYPYSFATSIETLQSATKLPPKECFYNDLDGTHCSDEDYQHAQRVWEKFDCKNMVDYTNLYCMLDTLLLAEVITDTRDMMYDKFGLDLAQYFSLPHMSMDIMLKMTKANIELISDL